MNVMSMPIFKYSTAFIVALLLTGCNNNGNEGLEKAEEQAGKQAEENGKIECALSGGQEFSRICKTERIAGPEGQIQVIRHPDGGFRRFKILTDGRGLAPAEGADLIKITPLDSGEIEVAIAEDRYRLPAKIKSSDKEKPPSAPEAVNSPATSSADAG